MSYHAIFPTCDSPKRMRLACEVGTTSEGLDCLELAASSELIMFALVCRMALVLQRTYRLTSLHMKKFLDVSRNIKTHDFQSFFCSIHVHVLTSMPFTEFDITISSIEKASRLFVSRFLT